jgi:hypothetical protein
LSFKSFKAKIVVLALFKILLEPICFPKIFRIPPNSKITILELVYSVSLITIFLIILQETVIKSIVGKNEKLYNSIRWITFVIMILFFLFFNYLIPTRFN